MTRAPILFANPLSVDNGLVARIEGAAGMSASDGAVGGQVPSGAAGTPGAQDDSYKWKVLAAVVVGLFMVILDATVVNVALRSLQEKYTASTSDVQWVISLYTLSLGIATRSQASSATVSAPSVSICQG
jgi:hypothetical protein